MIKKMTAPIKSDIVCFIATDWKVAPSRASSPSDAELKMKNPATVSRIMEPRKILSMLFFLFMCVLEQLYILPHCLVVWQFCDSRETEMGDEFECRFVVETSQILWIIDSFYETTY